ncbi:hypothetical protein LCGC14_1254200 [marine sediment metagenome]|uniref:Right handed beta helix domain-containing protein n=1 Tax=marine sediment metagenome TaxID=412755 RepID=A0A0F9LNV0_9ZZZZ
MGQQVNVGRELVFAPGAIVVGSWNGSFDQGGTTYYVNNITGNSTADGLSWNNPVAQVSDAITLSEASRLIHPGTTTNDYIRNKIIVQGTGTAYTKLTSLPLYCDIIGLGANVRGTNQGIPRIGSDTVAESGCVLTATVRGLGVYNIQFQAGLNEVCLQIASMYRSEFVNCSFMTNGAATGNPTAAIYVTTAIGSVIFKDCFIGSSGSLDTEPDIGMKIEGTHFHNCLVENCFITGLTGVTIASTVTQGYGSIFKNNYIGDGSQTMAICVDDNATAGAIVFAGNYLRASGLALDLENDGAGRAIGNYEINGFVAANA